MNKRIVLIDYGSGNLRSAAKAFEHVADDGTAVIVTADPAALDSASHIVLPGVGAFADCMQGLVSIEGMREALEENVHRQHKPFLGICVGMQMLFEEGLEHGVHPGLGWLRGKVAKLVASKASDEMQLTTCNLQLKIPHMGWNELNVEHPHPLLAGIADGDHAYFVHSYHALCADAADIIATTDYGGPVTAAVARNNIMGTQFHPEKSQELGLKLLRNFLMIR